MRVRCRPPSASPASFQSAASFSGTKTLALNLEAFESYLFSGSVPYGGNVDWQSWID